MSGRKQIEHKSGTPGNHQSSSQSFSEEEKGILSINISTKVKWEFQLKKMITDAEDAKTRIEGRCLSLMAATKKDERNAQDTLMERKCRPPEAARRRLVETKEGNERDTGIFSALANRLHDAYKEIVVKYNEKNPIEASPSLQKKTQLTLKARGQQIRQACTKITRLSFEAEDATKLLSQAVKLDGLFIEVGQATETIACLPADLSSAAGRGSGKGSAEAKKGRTPASGASSRKVLFPSPPAPRSLISKKKLKLDHETGSPSSPPSSSPLQSFFTSNITTPPSSTSPHAPRLMSSTPQGDGADDLKTTSPPEDNSTKTAEQVIENKALAPYLTPDAKHSGKEENPVEKPDNLQGGTESPASIEDELGSTGTTWKTLVKGSLAFLTTAAITIALAATIFAKKAMSPTVVWNLSIGATALITIGVLAAVLLGYALYKTKRSPYVLLAKETKELPVELQEKGITPPSIILQTYAFPSETQNAFQETREGDTPTCADIVRKLFTASFWRPAPSAATEQDSEPTVLRVS